jgi:hypothetical protein
MKKFNEDNAQNAKSAKGQTGIVSLDDFSKLLHEFD